MNTAVIGVGGYAGGELARLLLKHPRLKNHPPLFLGRGDSAGVPLVSLHPQLSGNGHGLLQTEPFSWDLLQSHSIDLLFLATPHEQSRAWVPDALAHGLRVIDLSGAWRLEQADNRSVYRFSDEASNAAVETQRSAVYGMPELHAESIASARLVANPGCYATSIILALKPLAAAGLLDLDQGIICDSKSGVSGAGKSPTPTTHFMHAADNLSAYALFSHRHLGEILEQLEITRSQLIFTPHLLPIPRGILSTIYVRFSTPQTSDGVTSCFRNFYSNHSLVRLFPTPQLPEIQFSVRTNYCDIGFQLAPDQQRCIIISCLDNLLKGAAGQAIQNMNIMNGWNEAEGLL